MNKSESIVNAVALLSGAAIGFGIGYYVQKRKFDGWLEKEMTSDAERKTGIFDTPEHAAEALHGETVLSETFLTKEEINKLLIETGHEPLHDHDTFDGERILAETGFRIEDDIDPVEFMGDEAEMEEEPNPEPLPEDEEEENPLKGLTGDDIVNSIWANKANTDESNFVNIVENPDQADMPEPDAEKSYIITVDQFMQETEYDDNKLSLLWFEGDEVMTDERELLIPDAQVDVLVGRENLKRFGLGSRDRNALYVRNDKKKMDIEIIRDVRT